MEVPTPSLACVPIRLLPSDTTPMALLWLLPVLPLLPLKNSVLFPGLLMPLSVGRTTSLAAVEAAVATEDKEIIVVAQRDASADMPAASDLFTIGTRAAIPDVAPMIARPVAVSAVFAAVEFVSKYGTLFWLRLTERIASRTAPCRCAEIAALAAVPRLVAS